MAQNFRPANVDFLPDLCKALGITKPVRSLTLRIAIHDVVLVDVEHILEVEEGDRLLEVMRRYQVPIADPQSPETSPPC